MDWFFTKVSDNTELKSDLVGYSELSGGGNYIIKGKLPADAMERAIKNQCYPFTFKIYDINQKVIVEGISEGFTDKPLLYIDLQVFKTSLSHIEFFEGEQSIKSIDYNELEPGD